MKVETFHLPLTWLTYWFRSYLVCQLERESKIKKAKSLSNVNMSTVKRVPQNFSAFFCGC